MYSIYFRSFFLSLSSLRLQQRATLIRLWVFFHHLRTKRCHWHSLRQRNLIKCYTSLSGVDVNDVEELINVKFTQMNHIFEAQQWYMLAVRKLIMEYAFMFYCVQCAHYFLVDYSTNMYEYVQCAKSIKFIAFYIILAFVFTYVLEILCIELMRRSTAR